MPKSNFFLLRMAAVGLVCTLTTYAPPSIAAGSVMVVAAIQVAVTAVPVRYL